MTPTESQPHEHMVYDDDVAEVVTRATGRIGDLALVSATFPPQLRGKVMGAIKGALFSMLTEIDLLDGDGDDE